MLYLLNKHNKNKGLIFFIQSFKNGAGRQRYNLILSLKADIPNILRLSLVRIITGAPCMGWSPQYLTDTLHASPPNSAFISLTWFDS